jgi:peptidoglycan hydrolase-like protein with peptidoglycan-binding domain
MLNFRKISIRFFVLIFILSFISTPFLAQAALFDPTGDSFDTAGNGNTNPEGMTYYNNFFWIADPADDEVYKYNTDGTYATSFDTAADGLSDPRGITNYNDFIWITDTTDDEVYKYNPDGTYASESFDTAASGAGFPTAITSYAGFFWIYDSQDDGVYKFNLDGTYSGTFFSTIDNVDFIYFVDSARGITGYDDDLWLTDNVGGIEQFQTDGTWVAHHDALATLSDGTGIVTAGDNFWVADITNAQVFEFEGSTPPDATAPTVQTLSPADGVDDVATDANLVITFDEAVDVESGNIVIKKLSNNNTVETIDVTGGLVTGTGTTTITINPSSDLNQGIEYYVQIDATAFDDAASNSYAGIADSATWNFTTEGSSSSSGSRSSKSTKTSPVVKNSTPSTDTDGCTVITAYSPKTGAKCPDVPTPTPSAPSCNLTLTLKQGSAGEEVKCLQNKLQITSDGMFGPMTKASVMTFQTANALTPDGIVGPMTRGVMNGN